MTRKTPAGRSVADLTWTVNFFNCSVVPATYLQKLYMVMVASSHTTKAVAGLLVIIVWNVLIFSSAYQCVRPGGNKSRVPASCLNEHKRITASLLFSATPWMHEQFQACDKTTEYRTDTGRVWYVASQNKWRLSWKVWTETEPFG